MIVILVYYQDRFQSSKMSTLSVSKSSPQETFNKLLAIERVNTILLYLHQWGTRRGSTGGLNFKKILENVSYICFVHRKQPEAKAKDTEPKAKDTEAECLDYYVHWGGTQ